MLRFGMRSFMILFCFAAAPVTIGCKKNAESTASNQADGRVQKPIVSFSWSLSSQNLTQHLHASVDDARSRNLAIKRVDDIPGGARYGWGLYTAIDPIQSSIYGTELTCAVFKKDVSFKDSAFESVADISSSASVLRYPFSPSLFTPRSAALSEGGFQSGDHNWASVVRDFSAFDFKRSQKISFRGEGNGVGLRQDKLQKAAEFLQKNDFCGALAQFENEFSTLFHAAHAAKSDAIFANMTFLLPLFRASWSGGNGTEIGALGQIFVRNVRKNSALLTRLKNSNLVINDDPVRIFAVLMDVLTDVAERKNDKLSQVSLNALDVLRETGVFTIQSSSVTYAAVAADLEQSLRQRFQQWGQQHPAETEFMKRFYDALYENSLRAL